MSMIGGNAFLEVGKGGSFSTWFGKYFAFCLSFWNGDKQGLRSDAYWTALTDASSKIVEKCPDPFGERLVYAALEILTERERAERKAMKEAGDDSTAPVHARQEDTGAGSAFRQGISDVYRLIAHQVNGGKDGFGPTYKANLISECNQVLDRYPDSDAVWIWVKFVYEECLRRKAAADLDRRRKDDLAFLHHKDQMPHADLA